MDEKGLGKRLQKARQNAGLTQQQLCQQANLSFSTLTKIERGAIKSPSIFTIQSISSALGVGLDELVGNASPSRPARKLKKTKSGVSFIYFDVNGCLVTFYQRAFSQLAMETGATPDVVETTFWHLNDEVCRGIITLEDFNARMAERIGVQELLEWASQHYKVGLLTNIMPGFLSVMRREGIIPNLDYDSIIDSSEVAAIKPESTIFEVAQERAGVPVDEILLIDDSRVNLMAAGRMDWHVLWFDDSRPDESVERVRTALEPAE
jgi:HAD superfamily hydrolase (TIGR01509 family)